MLSPLPGGVTPSCSREGTPGRAAQPAPAQQCPGSDGLVPGAAGGPGAGKGDGHVVLVVLPNWELVLAAVRGAMGLEVFYTRVV